MRIYNVAAVNDDTADQFGTTNEVQLNAYNLFAHTNSPIEKITSSPNERKISFAQLTRDVLPRLDNYRHSLKTARRPSLGFLHGKAFEHNENTTTESEASDVHKGIKLGWIQGVLIPCLLNIWGVMLFLRVTWVIAQAGIGLSLAIIAISYLVCVLTTLSLSAICTNGEVKGGGVYYIISRSLGPEFGASVGIIFAFANTVAASMNTIGFCDSLNELLGSHDLKIIDGAENDTRIIGTIALIVMILVCAVGMDWESKAQNALIAIILVAIFNFLIGVCIGPRDDIAQAQGFVGLNGQVFLKNFGPDFRFSEGRYHNFFSVFAIFFPSVTGLQAGANISGDLKNPAHSIPRGTLLALLVSATSYVSFVFFAGSAALRQASGNVSDLIDGSGVGMEPNCLIDNACEYGLHNSYTIMYLMAAWGPLIFAGTWAATLSTALTNLLSVPRLLQALGRDQIYPGLIFFSKGYGRHGEPYRGYALTLIISTIFLLIANLNIIAPLITTFYLASYALINFCTFHASFVKPLGWRPTFKFYNVWLSLFGFLLCITFMFLINWVAGLVTIVIIFALYLIVVYRKPDVNWGSSTQAQTYKTALLASYRLQNIDDHVKNYTPQVLVLAGSPEIRPAIVDLANSITKRNSLMIIGNVITMDISHKTRINAIKEGHKWLQMRKIKAFYNIVQSSDFESGVHSLIQTAGIGKLAPNIMLMGYKGAWQTCSTDELQSYFHSIHKTFTNRLALMILRMPNGMDCSHLNLEANENSTVTGSSTLSLHQSEESVPTNGDSILKKTSHLAYSNPIFNLDEIDKSQNPLTATELQLPPFPNQIFFVERKQQESTIFSIQGGSPLPKDVFNDMSYFHTKKIDAIIDVWWLYDDGGLTILVPYILSLRSQWKKCKIRVFALTNEKLELETEERNMADLLTKLRIDYSSLTMIQDIHRRPQQHTIDFHLNLLDGFLEGQRSEGFVSDAELATLEKKTHSQLRLRELLLEHSNQTSLVVMSLPMPLENAVSAPLYMSWLEMLTNNMPPILLIRGNQNSVLTFYA